MSYSLPSIERGKRSSNTGWGKNNNNNSNNNNNNNRSNGKKSPIAATTDDVETVEEFHREIHRRTVHRVCSSTYEHEGYLKLLRNVRKQFLNRPEPETSTRLPLISKTPIPPHTWGGRPSTLSPLASQAAATTTASLSSATARETRVENEDNKKKGRTTPSLFSRGLRFKKEGSEFISRAHEVQSHQIPLAVLEEVERQHLIETEVWERRVILQMMAVSYVTFVLREELEDLQNSERRSRANIVYGEEKERHWMINESEIGVQLIKYKIALRAKEDKRKRLEEADALYPLKGNDNRSKVTPHPPQQEPDARLILQRYVRLKHATDIAARQNQMVEEQEPQQSDEVQTEEHQTVSPGRCPMTSLTLRTKLRNTIGISAYVDLLDKDAEDRKLIEQCEAEEFEGIMALFQEEYSVVQVWQHKRMHLERLLYWQKLREERRKQVKEVVEAEVMKTTIIFTDEFERCIVYEDKGRRVISAEENASRAIIHKMYEESTFYAKMDSLIAEHEESYKAFVEDEAVLRQLWLQRLELALRVSLMHAWEYDVETRILKKFSLLQFLTGQDSRCTNQIVTIQRAFRLWKNGRLGWRFTHREVGRIIQSNRDAKKIERGMNSLNAFKASLMADCAAIQNEILAIHKAEIKDLCEEEFRHRVIVTSQEEWEKTKLYQAERSDILENIILPKIEYCLSSEIDRRRELDVAEEFERLQMCGIFKNLFSIMANKWVLEEKEETIDRYAIEESERQLFLCIRGEELDEREIIRITAMERDAALAEERQFLADSLFYRMRILQESHEAKIYQFMWNCKQGALEIEACDIRPRQTLFQNFLTDVRESFIEEAFRFNAESAAFFLEYHDDTIQTACLAIIPLQETVRRDAEMSEEQQEWVALVKMANEEASDQLRLLQRRMAAATLIAQFYRRYRRGEVGRSGRRQYLHERYAFKKEQKELREMREAQRMVVQECKNALAKEIRHECEAKQHSIGLMLQVLEEKSEPWARAEIEKLEHIVYNVMLRNFASNATVWEPDAVAVLWQLESYERVRIMQEWQKEFECVFEPKKSTFLLDLMACKVQRHWRRYITRKHQLAALREALRQVIQQEAEERACVELHEMDAYVFDLVKPLQGTILLKEYLMNDVPQLLSHMCFDVDFAYAIEEDEWRNRMLLLWRMRHHLFETTLEQEEPRTRETLEQNYFYDAAEQMELMEDEKTVREVLQNERILFLLRILMREEREHRDIIELEYDKTVLEITESEFRVVLYRTYNTTLVDPICVQFACEQAAVIGEEESRERQEILRVLEAEKVSSEHHDTSSIAQNENSDVNITVAETISKDSNQRQLQEEVQEPEEPAHEDKEEEVEEPEEPAHEDKEEELQEPEEPAHEDKEEE
ncbi:uncharacterized protein TM35_000091390, partial [Trypanosoma theileri]